MSNCSEMLPKLPCYPNPPPPIQYHPPTRTRPSHKYPSNTEESSLNGSLNGSLRSSLNCPLNSPLDADVITNNRRDEEDILSVMRFRLCVLAAYFAAQPPEQPSVPELALVLKSPMRCAFEIAASSFN